MKYTVLVVEDERDQRRALIERVDWESAGFEVAGEAENGFEALELTETLEPDLIITDIRMPMMTGLELARRVRQLRPMVQIVILSGYDSFEYARTAIEYNIISYLLKPISPAELTDELKEIHRKMDEKLGSVLTAPDTDLKLQLHRLSVNEFLLPLMLGSNEEKPDESALFARAAELGIIDETGDNLFCVLVSKFSDENRKKCTNEKHASFIDTVLSRYMRSVSFTVYGRVVTLAVTDGKEDISSVMDMPLKEIVQTAKRLLSQRCTVGVSRGFSELSNCSAAYFQAITARRYTSDGAGEVRFINDQERDGELELDKIEKSAVKLEQLLKVGKENELEGFINSLYESNTPENADLLVMQIISTVYRITSAVSEKAELLALFSSNPIFARLTSYSSENVMKNDLIDFCEKAKTIIARSQRRDSEVLCDKVVQIIDDRYSDETLSLSGVSRELGVSPNYLSALIKKTKKENFVNLLTERRMRAAYDMLVCTGMKVLEISEKCGYSDQHYFSYCFKKFYGDTPNKVRVAHRGE